MYDFCQWSGKRALCVVLCYVWNIIGDANIYMCHSNDNKNFAHSEFRLPILCLLVCVFVCLRCSAYAATLSLYVLRVFSLEFLFDTLACRKQVKFVSQMPSHIPVCNVCISHTTQYIFVHFIAFFIIHSLVKFIFVPSFSIHAWLCISFFCAHRSSSLLLLP